MELMNKASEPIIPRKRPLNHDSNDCDLEGFRKQKPRVQAVRDFPPGCGIIEVDRKPLKKLINVNSNLQKMTVENPNKLGSFKPIEFGLKNGLKKTSKAQFRDHNDSQIDGAHKPKATTTIVTQLKRSDDAETNFGKKKPVNSKTLDHHKLSSFELAEFKRNKPAAKVKFLDPTYTKECHDHQPKVTTMIVSRGKRLKKLENVDTKLRKLTSNGEKITTSVSRKDHIYGEKIKEAMSVFDQVYKRLYQENKVKLKGEKIAHWRVPVEAAKLVKQMLNWVEPQKSLGRVSGVQIGDKFKYRSQLKMIGLHCQLQLGIDYTKIKGKNLALSIVDSHKYLNERGSGDTLVYCGQGGLLFLGKKMPPEDQKFERGNLALKNSMDAKNPVRVIRKLEVCKNNEAFVYDGLYVVNHYTQERSDERRIVLKFHLKRLPDQPPLHQMLNASC